MLTCPPATLDLESLKQDKRGDYCWQTKKKSDWNLVFMFHFCIIVSHELK